MTKAGVVPTSHGHQYRNHPTGVITGPPGPARKNFMDRFIDPIEWVAAFFVGIVALNTFAACSCATSFADASDYYNFGQFLLGILIFWGIAATSYRGTHITVDLVWANADATVSALDRRVRDPGAAVRGHGADLHPVRQGRRYPAGHIVTMDLQVPIWPFFGVLDRRRLRGC